MVTVQAVTPRTWLLLSWILVGAAVLVAHVVLVWQILRRMGDPPGRQRWWALIPVVAPFFAYHDKRWVTLGVWGSLVLAYVVLRFLEG